ncbi:MAG: DUF5985 family protein [Pseudomonadota bacterium]|nr:DUF5985 family protein [Pseudomonadota bacterium]
MAEFFPTTVYLLCFGTSAACALLLARSYFASRTPLLLWSAICFLFLSANNLVVVVDLLMIPDISFRVLRLVLALAAVSVLLFGFVWDLERD